MKEHDPKLLSISNHTMPLTNITNATSASTTMTSQAGDAINSHQKKGIQQQYLHNLQSLSPTKNKKNSIFHDAQMTENNTRMDTDNLQSNVPNTHNRSSISAR
jgi:uncharacterized membrane protein